eukprot:5908730-Pyramimonas_sp.AAC.1
MGTYTEPARPVWAPIQSLNGLCGILYRAYTPCMGSYTEPTRPVWDPIQSLHACLGSYIESARLVRDPIQIQHALYGIPYTAYTASKEYSTYTA